MVKKIPLLLILWVSIFSYYPINPSLDTLSRPQGNLDRAKEYLEAGLRQQAVSHLAPLAIEGVPEAQYLLGQEYQAHLDVIDYAFSRDICSATYWHDKAARQDYAPAQYEMYLAYHDYGDGVIPDTFKAYFWLLLAQKNGYNIKMEELENLERQLSTQERKKAADKVSTWVSDNEPAAKIYRFPSISGFSEWWIPLSGIWPCGMEISWLSAIFH